MMFHPFDIVVLQCDLPEHKLHKGDLCVIVELYPEDGLEVEFVTGAGQTQALLTLSIEDVRPIGELDMLSTRSIDVA